MVRRLIQQQQVRAFQQDLAEGNTATFTAGKPKKLFDGPYERSNALWANYDASPDGQHLLMVRRETPPSSVTRINVVLNWLDDLKQKLPVP